MVTRAPRSDRTRAVASPGPFVVDVRNRHHHQLGVRDAGAPAESSIRVGIDKVDALEAKKIVFVAPETREVQALWTVKNTYYWEQTFPPGKIVTVEHTYAPVVGGSFWYDEKFTPETLAKHDLFKDFCIDQGTLNAIRAREAAVRAKHKVDLPLSYLDIRYILKTGRNWKGPIGSFKLTVDKGAPDNVVSFCGEGVTKSGPTTFVMQKTNWEPDADLAVIILAAQNL